MDLRFYTSGWGPEWLLGERLPHTVVGHCSHVVRERE